MKCGWFQIVNCAVHYFQTPFNVALIIEQLSNYNMLLRENIKIDKDCFMKKNNLISNEIRHGKKLSALATEHMPKMKHNKSAGDCSKVDDDWINPKKSVPMTCFFKKCKNEIENVKVNNECKMSLDEYDNDEEEDDEVKFYEMKEEGSGS